MRVKGSELPKFPTSSLAALGRYRHNLGRGQKGLLMPLVAFPGSRFARSLRFPFRSLIWGVRGWRPVGVLGILTKPRFELFHALGQFLDQLVLLQDQSPDSGRRLFPVLIADGQSLGKILQRHPGTLRLVSLLASCSNLSVSSTRTFSACPVKNVCGLHKSSPPLLITASAARSMCPDCSS